MRFFARVAIALAGLIGMANAQQMAVTFDDLPIHGSAPPGVSRVEIARSILDTAKAEHLPPLYGFINAVETVRDPKLMAVLQLWRDAGQPLGNHTWSHMDLNKVSAPGFELNIAKDEPLLRQLMAGAPEQDWKWFRFPYLHEGGTPAKRRAVQGWLAGHGYRVAEVNMDFEDSLWNDPYARCMVKHDAAKIRWLHDSYLATADEYLGYFRKLAQTVYGRDVKYVLLLHVGAFDAKMLPELLELYRRRGMTFISLPDAESDAAYKDDPGAGSVSGGAQLELMMDARKLEYPANTKPFRELERACR